MKLFSEFRTKLNILIKLGTCPTRCKMHPSSLYTLRAELAYHPKIPTGARTMDQIVEALTNPKPEAFTMLEGIELVIDESLPEDAFMFDCWPTARPDGNARAGA